RDRGGAVTEVGGAGPGPGPGVAEAAGGAERVAPAHRLVGTGGDRVRGDVVGGDDRLGRGGGVVLVGDGKGDRVGARGGRGEAEVLGGGVGDGLAVAADDMPDVTERPVRRPRVRVGTAQLDRIALGHGLIGAGADVLRRRVVRGEDDLGGGRGV